MSVQVKSPTGDFPGERRLSSFRNGELVLTERSVYHVNPDAMHLEFQAYKLAHVDEVGLVPYSRFRPTMLLIPVALVAIGVFLSSSGNPGPFFVALIFALWSLPLAWFSEGMFAIRLVTSKDRLVVPVPRRLRWDARAFVRAVRQACPRDRTTVETPGGHPAPTTRPFRG